MGYFEDKPELHLFLRGGEKEMRIVIKGDPKVITKMIRTAMQARQDIAAAFIVAVVDYATQEGFDSGDLGTMAYIP